MRSERPAIERTWTDVEGLRVHARVARASAPPGARDVVLVHGAVVSSRYMVPLARELARDVRVHAPDLPGFGLSEGPREALDVAGLAKALLAWLDANALDRPVLVASSFGCQVAVHALRTAPQRFECAVLQGPTFDPQAGPLRQALRWVVTGLHERATLHAVVARDYADCGLRRAVLTFRNGLADSVESLLEDVRAPVLVVRGGRDRVVPERWARKVANALPDAELVVLGGVAHAMSFSAAPQLAAIVRRFLAMPARERRERPRSAPRSVASFDSATAMLQAASRALCGRGLEGLGAVPRAVAPLAERVVQPVNMLPQAAREEVYRRASGAEGIPAAKLHRVNAEEIARWMVRCHPRRRRYPAVVVGSSSGAIMHLAAALGVPFLPQTVLVPVRQPDAGPDQPRRGLELARAPAQLLLDANPDWQLHHMHDPNHDRLTLAWIAYFRVKRRRLGETLTRYLSDALPPGATLLVSECRLRWPATRVGERHVFQFGALGGMTADEFHADERWDAPASDTDAPEAEWGFEPSLLDDLRELAERRSLRLRRIVFDDPEDPSPLVADLYRWWYTRRGLAARRLLVESFMLLDPHWTLRTASVPLWLKFAVESSAARLERYLAESEPYPELRLALFSHGSDSTGLAGIDRWRSVLRGSPGDARFLGVDVDRFPRDFASFGAFHRELRALDRAAVMPRPLTLDELDEFLRHRRPHEAVTWLDD